MRFRFLPSIVAITLLWVPIGHALPAPTFAAFATAVGSRQHDAMAVIHRGDFTGQDAARAAALVAGYSASLVDTCIAVDVSPSVLGGAQVADPVDPGLRLATELLDRLVAVATVRGRFIFAESVMPVSGSIILAGVAQLGTWSNIAGPAGAIETCLASSPAIIVLISDLDAAGPMPGPLAPTNQLAAVARWIAQADVLPPIVIAAYPANVDPAMRDAFMALAHASRGELLPLGNVDHFDAVEAAVRRRLAAPPPTTATPVPTATPHVTATPDPSPLPFRTVTVALPFQPVIDSSDRSVEQRGAEQPWLVWFAAVAGTATLLIVALLVPGRVPDQVAAPVPAATSHRIRDVHLSRGGWSKMLRLQAAAEEEDKDGLVNVPSRTRQMVAVPAGGSEMPELSLELWIHGSADVAISGPGGLRVLPRDGGVITVSGVQARIVLPGMPLYG